MLALRIIIIASAGLIILSLLGYALSKDRRWLRYTILLVKVLVALVALILVALVLERLLLVL